MVDVGEVTLDIHNESNVQYVHLSVHLVLG